MNKKTIYLFLNVMLGIFFSCLFVRAVPPIIKEIPDPEKPQRRILSIMGDIQTKHFSMRIRTVEKKDIKNVDGSPGLVSLAEMDEKDMEYDLPSLYAEGKTIRTLYETEISYGKWKRRLEKGPHYESTVLYVLEDVSTSTPTFMGYVIFDHESQTELRFSPHIVRPFQGRGVMKELGDYFLTEFIPEIRSHLLTRSKALPYETLILKLYSYKVHPRLDDITKAIKKFSDEAHIPISHPTRVKWSIDITHLPKKELVPPLQISPKKSPTRGKPKISIQHSSELGSIPQKRYNLRPPQSSRLSLQGSAALFEPKRPLKRLQEERRQSALF